MSVSAWIPRARTYLCVLACLLLAIPAVALAAEAFQRYNVSDGLANNVAFDVAEDKYGFIWVTTRNGISKFDGSDFSTYRPVPPGHGAAES
jgi:ligand-binding sensor domain-containing protein